jgi:hypothetical protein
MPADLRKTCPKSKGGCGAQFTPRRGTRREKCFTCSPERVAGVRQAPPAAAEPAAPGVPVEGETTAMIRSALARAGHLDTVPGALAIRLARTLDDPRLGNAQVSGLVAQLAKLTEPLMRDLPVEDDELDEFTAAMRAKAESA